MTDVAKSDKSDNTLPDIVKKDEFELMLELITQGLWKGVNLAAALHVNQDTITAWKKRPEAKDAHRRAILKFVRRRTDVEKILKELEIETEPDGPSLIQNNFYQLTDGQLDTFIQSKIRELGVGTVVDGEAEADSGESTEVRKAVS